MNRDVEIMARPQKYRTIFNPPVMTGFKPFGLPECNTGSVFLSYEEYESFRLIDYDGLAQDQAAARMHISRPTFTRLYNKTLKTIATAFVEGKAMEIEGGNFIFDREWYKCKKCYRLIDGLENHIRCAGCNRYSTDELIPLNISGSR
jgi:uncharacterized protein